MDSKGNLSVLGEIFGQHTDSGSPLPFLQLGDIFTKGLDDQVYLVMSASCDLQFVPKEVSKSRIPDRNATILLLPGRICLPNECPKDSLSTGLIKISSEWRAIVWDRTKLTGVPHCLIRPLLQTGTGYNHSVRLRTARALEIQQRVFHQASTIGLEIQPPFVDELDVQVFARKAECFVKSGETIKGGLIRFHMLRTSVSVLVFKQAAIESLTTVLDAALIGEEQTAEGKKLAQLIGRIVANSSVLSRTPLAEPEAGKVKAVKAGDKFQKIAIEGLGLVVRKPSIADEDWGKIYYAIISIGNANE